MPTDCEYSMELLINEELKIPNPKPDIEHILEVNIKVEIIETIVKRQKLIFTGQLQINLEYIALVESGSQPVHFASFDLPFANFIKYPHQHYCNNCGLSYELEYHDFSITDTRNLNGTLVLRFYLDSKCTTFGIENNDLKCSQTCNNNDLLDCFPNCPLCLDWEDEDEG